MYFRRAIMVVHGFAGGVYDEQSIIDELQLVWNFDVYSYTLPGHERNLSKVKYEDWIRASEEKIEWLISKGYTKIYVIGHSMGGVIATYLATKYSEIKKVVLAAPAFNYLKADNENLNIKKSIQTAPKIIKDYSFQEIFARLLKLDISSVYEFRKLVKNYYDCPKELTQPIMILQGTNDSVVPISSSEYVYNSAKSKTKSLVLISDVTHDIFKSKKADEIANLVKNFLIHNKKGQTHIEL